MHKSFIISEEERKRILGIHKNATKNQYLQILSEATTHPKSKEPYKPDNTQIEEDIKNDSEIYLKADWKPCLAKMAKYKGWYKGTEGWNDKDGNSVATDFWTPSKTSGKGMMMYSWDGYIYKQTGDTLEENVFVRKFTCNERPFTSPAQSEGEIRKGTKSLMKGDKSPLVRTINNALVKANKLPQERYDSEVFDDATKAAVIEFQKENKDSKGRQLKPDGIVGINTFWALENSGNYPSGINPEAGKSLPSATGLGSTVKDFGTSMQQMNQRFTKSQQDFAQTQKGVTTDKTVSPGQQQTGAQGEKPKEETKTATDGTSYNMKRF